MNNVLVIPDIHCRKFWRKAPFEDFDKVVFLGDYFDPYPEKNLEDSPTIMLMDIITMKKEAPDKYILLVGNHDAHYLWGNFDRSTRYDKWHARQYENLFKENLTLFNFAFVDNDTIFTHAGILESWKNYFVENLELNQEYSILDIAKYLQNLSLVDIPYMFVDMFSRVSKYRSYFGVDYPSFLWADIRDHISKVEGENIIPLGDSNVYQIFGHTKIKDKIVTNKWACLDCSRPFIVDTVSHNIYEC